MKHSLALLLLLLFTPGANAQTIDPAEYERVLLPVLYEQVPGAFGSVWTSSLIMYNGSDKPAVYFPIDCFDLATCPASFFVPPHAARRPIRGASAGQPPGRLFYVRKDVAPFVEFNLRAQDLSRQAETWGTEVPVIRERDLLTTTTHLINIPMDPRFRDSLRVYDFDATGTGEVTVSAADLSGNAVGSVHLHLAVPNGPRLVPTIDPGYAEIPSLVEAFPASDAIVLSIAPITPGLRYWAFVSVTNDVTQHVTTVTPH